MIFGPKIHKEFPRKYFTSSACGGANGFEGFWESIGNGNYKHPGVDAEISVGSDVSIVCYADLLT